MPTAKQFGLAGAGLPSGLGYAMPTAEIFGQRVVDLPSMDFYTARKFAYTAKLHYSARVGHNGEG